MADGQARTGIDQALPARQVDHADWIVPAVTVLGLLLLWEGAVRALDVPVHLVPAPSLIVAEIAKTYPQLLEETLYSVVAIIAGFLLAVAIGIPAASLMVYFRFFRRAVYPVLLTAQVLPKVALAPLFIVWFGFGLLPKVLMTFLIAF
jgi:NitT/TauT family transport system permease protein